MIVKCERYGKRFDDTFRSTFCPHDTFLANDGENNFRHHEESFLSSRPDEDDVNVLAALREGRHADDIALVECGDCGVYSYYNEGSHATCRRCGRVLIDATDDAITLADYWDSAKYPVDERSS